MKFLTKIIFLIILISLPFLSIEVVNVFANEFNGDLLWEEFKKNPANHLLIPDNSYAGYYSGTKEIPKINIRSAFNVKRSGAIGDGKHDDTKAIQSALDKAEVIFIPKGRYIISSRLKIRKSNSILIGAGVVETVLVFKKSLSEIDNKYLNNNGVSLYAWNGGLIDVSPPPLFSAKKSKIGQIWDLGKQLTKFKNEYNRGEFNLEVVNSAELISGKWIFINWPKPLNKKTLNSIAGFSDDFNFNWNENGKAWIERNLPWPVQIKEVKGNIITLAQPLRMDIKKFENVKVYELNNFLHDVGIQDISLEMNSGGAKEHLKEQGFNGIYFSKIVNSWIKNVSIKNADSGIILDGVKNITVEKITLEGERKYHHGFFTKNAHDCLVNEFVINSPVIHGINSDRFGTGNVWSRGLMRHGTFDMHRGMQFDIIRTQIEINNDGVVGGEEDAGPMQGRRAVHWNIKLKGKSNLVNEDSLMHQGVLVGIYENEKKPKFFPKIENLFEAQRKFRFEQKQLIK